MTRLNVGGPAVQAMLLTERLDPARYDQVLVTGLPGRSEGDMVELHARELRPTVIPELVRELSPLKDLIAFGRIVAILRRVRPDIVHTHLSKAGVLGRLAARLVGVPVVVHTFHGTVLSGYFSGPASRGVLWVETALAHVSTRLIAISPRQRADLERWGIGRGRTVVIPLGLDLSKFIDPPRGRLRSELRIDGGRPLVGIVARLVPIKGVDVFLRASAEVAKARPDAAFVIIGDGELRGHLEALARDIGVAGRAHFLGWRADIEAIYADLDMVVLSSHNEGTPVSVIEACASGLPVVATNVGGVPDIVSEREGILVRDGDHRGIATAVLRLIDDPDLRERLGRAGRARVNPEHDIGALVRRIDALYSSLTRRSPA